MVRHKSKKPVLESRKPSSLTRLFDEIYKDKLKTPGLTPAGALDVFVDEVLAYAEGGAPLGMGSSRIVIAAEGEVIKIALNEAGFAQNGIEASLGNDPEVEDVIVPVTSTSDVVDHEGFLWITSAKAAPVRLEGFDKEWQNIRALLKDAAKGNLPGSENDMKGTQVAVPNPQKKEKKRDEDISISEVVTPDMLKAFSNLVKRYPDINTGDLYKPDSWGIHGGKLKLLDAGFTNSIKRGYYISAQSGGLLYGGHKQAKKTAQSKAEERAASTEQKISANIETARGALRQKSFPQETALLLFLRGLVEPLPRRISQYNPDVGITKFDINAAKTTVDDNYEKIVGYIEKVPDTSLRAELGSGLEGVLAARGVAETLLRKYIKLLM